MLERVFACIFLSLLGTYPTLYSCIVLSFFDFIDMHCVLEAFIPTIREVAYNMGQYSHGPDDDVQVVTITRVAQLFIHLTTTNTRYTLFLHLSAIMLIKLI